MKNPEWKELLAGVPDIACVAFAARCARRVQPLFLVSWPEAPQRLYHLLDGAIDTVEESTTESERTNSTFAFNGMSAVKAAYNVGAEQAAAVASTVACATQALAAVGYGDLSLTHSVQAADYALKVFGFGAFEGHEDALMEAREAMLEDVKRLRQGVEAGELANHRALNQDFFGLLWPHGEPDYVIQLHGLDG